MEIDTLQGVWLSGRASALHLLIVCGRPGVRSSAPPIFDFSAGRLSALHALFDVYVFQLSALPIRLHGFVDYDKNWLD